MPLPAFEDCPGSRDPRTVWPSRVLCLKARQPNGHFSALNVATWASASCAFSTAILCPGTLAAPLSQQRPWLRGVSASSTVAWGSGPEEQGWWTQRFPKRPARRRGRGWEGRLAISLAPLQLELQDPEGFASGGISP